MREEFAYIQKGKQYFPVIDVTVRYLKKNLTIKALVDSGASFSVFRPEIADYLGVHIERGKKMYLEGIGGRILGYLHNLNVSVGNTSLRCKIVFSREFTVSFNILGRDNFFLPFSISFLERRRKVIIRKG